MHSVASYLAGCRMVDGWPIRLEECSNFRGMGFGQVGVLGVVRNAN